MSTQQIKMLSFTLGLIFVLGIAAGCSTTGSLKMHESMEGKPIKGAVVALIISSPNANVNDNVVIKLWEQLTAHLLGRGLFKNVTGEADQQADYKITIKLTEINEVSGVARVVWGGLAGTNKIAGDVSVIDVKTGKTVRSFSFTGESASHPFSGKSDIRDAIDRATEEIIKGLS